MAHPIFPISKGTRVLYRNTHFGTVQEQQMNDTYIKVIFDRPYIGAGKTQEVRVDDVEVVRDDAHERELTLQINKVAPSRSDWKPTGEVMSDEDAHKIIREMRDDVIASSVTIKHRLKQEQAEFDRDPAADTAAIIRRLEAKLADAVRQGTALAIACSKF